MEGLVDTVVGHIKEHRCFEHRIKETMTIKEFELAVKECLLYSILETEVTRSDTVFKEYFKIKLKGLQSTSTFKDILNAVIDKRSMDSLNQPVIESTITWIPF